MINDPCEEQEKQDKKYGNNNPLGPARYLNVVELSPFEEKQTKHPEGSRWDNSNKNWIAPSR